MSKHASVATLVVVLACVGRRFPVGKEQCKRICAAEDSM